MKKFLPLTMCLVLLASTAGSQITITPTDMPVVGDTLRYSTAATTSVNPATLATNTGANFVWNFSSLNPTTQLLQSFRSSASTPYALYFAGMIGYKRADSISLGPLTQKNVWDFYRNTSTRFSIEGTGFTMQGIPLASDYSDPDELYYFPLNYSDVDSGTFYVSTSLPGIGSYIQAGKRKNTVDGWGKITTPFGQFDVLRIKSVITETDTIKVTIPFPITLPFSNNRIEYRWLAKNIHIPILEVVISAGVTGTQVTSVKYRDTYRYIPVAPTANFVANNIYPKINNTVTFTDLSTDFPTRWKWTITPSTFTLVNGSVDTLKNIDVQFTANGNYTVSLRAQNSAGMNTTTKTAYIKVGDVPVIKFGTDKTNADIAAVVTLADSSSNTPTSWKWTILPSTFSFNAGSNDTLKSTQVRFNKGGFYTIDLKVTNPWGSDQATKLNYVWVNFASGIQSSDRPVLQVYPNPVTDELHFYLTEYENTALLIYNAYGELVYSGMAGAENSVNVKDLANGIYIIELKSSTESTTARFIKE